MKSSFENKILLNILLQISKYIYTLLFLIYLIISLRIYIFFTQIKYNLYTLCVNYGKNII